MKLVPTFPPAADLSWFVGSRKREATKAFAPARRVTVTSALVRAAVAIGGLLVSVVVADRVDAQSVSEKGSDPLRRLPASRTVEQPAKVPTALRTGAPSRGRGAADYGLPQVKAINDAIRARWTDDQITPSPLADEGEWCRRVFLDVIGRIPSVNELKEFLANKDANKKAVLVSKLIEDERYTEEYARNWTTIWTNVLIGRSGGTERNSLTNREGMQKYLRDCFARNKPYNDMVFELVTAEGDNAPGAERFNGAVNYLAMKVNEEKGTLATAATARHFLGLQIQCTQCHNHPFNDWKQQKFWEFNAFFRQTRAQQNFVEGTRDVESATLVSLDFSGEGADPAKAEIYYELRNGLLKVAYPVFVDGTAIAADGRVSSVNRRQELGKLMLQSEYLDQMAVNRYWAHFLGYGFTKPIDDMGPHNPPTHPELQAYLGQELRRNSYNLKDLIRWITLSEPYSLSSKIVRGNEQDDPLLGEAPRFSHFYLRQMQAEELYESLLVATRAAENRGSYEEQERAKSAWLNQFTLAFATDEGDEATTFNGTIPQALMMFNGELIQQAIRTEQGSFLWDLAASGVPPAQQIEYLYLAGLARRPTKDETRLADQLAQARINDQLGQNRKNNPNLQAASLAALQDVWWAVLNSNEFIINH